MLHPVVYSSAGRRRRLFLFVLLSPPTHSFLFFFFASCVLRADGGTRWTTSQEDHPHTRPWANPQKSAVETCALTLISDGGRGRSWSAHVVVFIGAAYNSVDEPLFLLGRKLKLFCIYRGRNSFEGKQVGEAHICLYIYRYNQSSIFSIPRPVVVIESFKGLSNATREQ